MTQFEYIILKNNSQLILKGYIPTIGKWASIVETCLVAIHVFLHIWPIREQIMGLWLYANDVSYIQRKHVLKYEQNKYIIQYAYHAIKIAHIYFSSNFTKDTVISW